MRDALRILTLLGLSLLGVAGTPLELPPQVDESQWADAMGLHRFSPGSASGPSAWARLSVAPDGTWTLEVHDEAGELRRARGLTPPGSEAERRDLLLRARGMTRPDAALPPLLLPAALKPPPAPRPKPILAPRPEPVVAALEPEPIEEPEPPEPPPGPGLFSSELGSAYVGVPRDLPRTDPLYPTNPIYSCFCRSYVQDGQGHFAVRTGFVFDETRACTCDAAALRQLEDRVEPPPPDRRRRFF